MNYFRAVSFPSTKMAISLIALALIHSEFEGAYFMNSSSAQEKEVPNYDEDKIPDFTLPDPLTAADGSKVESAGQWESRRAEILELFQQHVYGIAPPAPAELNFTVVSESDQALGGKAIRREVDVFFGEPGEEPKMRILIYLPKSKQPVALFVGLNFQGNHATTDDPDVSIPSGWVRNDDVVKDNQATEKSRGAAKSRWPYAAAIKRNYGVATIYCGDIDPDFDDGFQNGVHALDVAAGRKRDDHSWGTIAAWAWGLSRAMDYFEVDESIDHNRVAVLGHSRLGKTSLWAGASDPRFAMVISNNSGCGGAALSRRRIGESVQRINTVFPHWFNGKFKTYNHNENALPVDQHMLISLIAPRPVYVTSASEDLWADPKGEFLSCVHADPVYHLLTDNGLNIKEFPEVNSPSHSLISYHVREGKHDITEYDWQQFFDVADQFLRATD
jgi:hypothetical protein